VAASVTAQEAPQPPPSPTAPPGYVTREEYERLLRDQQAMRAELDAMKRQQAATQPRYTDADVQDQIRAIQKDIRSLHAELPGFQQVVFAGDFSTGFQSFKHNDSTFYATFSPLILWKPADRIVVETALDIGISSDPTAGSSTSVDLTIADVTYAVNDYLLVGGGLFVVPFGVYHNHFDPPWINKLPDDPLAFSDGGIAPSSEVGLFARGALPAGKAKITYDVYVTNGPQLVTNDPDAAGSLNFDDFTDLNGNKAAGGRIGIIPLPDLEAGYSIQYSQPNPSGFPRAHALLQAVDFSYRPDVKALRGVVDVRAEYVWSDVSKATYDPTGRLGFGPTSFSNHSEGAYAQLAYRPIHLSNAFLRKLEYVGRWDFLNTPLKSPAGEHEQRWEVGVDYWLASNAVFKISYEWDHRKVGKDQDGFQAQFGLGF
jgi:hypothetical protein